MDAHDWLALVTVFVLLLLSAFFAGSETALTASSRASMARLEKQGNQRAGIVNRLLEQRERLLGALLFGNNAVNIAASALTRLPLWRGNTENIVGVLHVKDLLRALHAVEGDASKVDIAALMAPPWFVPETRPVSEQLKAFRRRKTQLALVVDEYGVVEGLVTLEDILEEIVGDITDEHDVAIPGVRRQPDGSANVDGAVPIRDLNRIMEWNLPDQEATTIAGLVIHEARSIPEVGQSFTFHGFRFRVLRRERNRITALRIQLLPRKPAAKAG